MPAKSPLAPDRFPDLPAVDGLRLAAGHCGIDKHGRPDVMLAVMPEGGTVAGVLTRSLCPSAPVDWCRRALDDGRIRALVVNSANANAFTGAAGEAAVRATVDAAAARAGCRADEVFVASTGVIGETLPAHLIVDHLPRLFESLHPEAWAAAAEAIATTDTFFKGASATARIGGYPANIVGIAKGSGMIAPDMATMLVFLFTDACLPAAQLRPLLTHAVDRSFNCITVDGDTSTSDTVLLAATGRVDHPQPESWTDRLLGPFRRALTEVCRDLALQVVRDGEGAQKLVSITVSGASSSPSARKIGLAVANSPLVKTAIAGSDANWGRIVMAVGKSGQRADRDRLSVSIGGVKVAHNGVVVPGYDEAPVARHMAGREIDIAIDLGIGRGRATVWTCDLTHGYIDINADYRT